MRCPECGTTNGDGASYCQNCGAELPEPAVTPANGGRSGGRLLAYALGVAFMAALAAGVAQWAVSQVDSTGVTFLVTFIAVGAFLWQKGSGPDVVGSGLYVVALLLPTVPLGIYLGAIATGTTSGIELVGNVMALLFWLVIMVVVAGLAAGLGYGVKRQSPS